MKGPLLGRQRSAGLSRSEAPPGASFVAVVAHGRDHGHPRRLPGAAPPISAQQRAARLRADLDRFLAEVARAPAPPVSAAPPAPALAPAPARAAGPPARRPLTLDE